MITLSQTAKDRILALRSQKGQPDLNLRITITAGGCSGFDCQFSLDNTRGEEDLLLSQDSDLSIVTDEASFSLIDGSLVDYKSDLIGSAFVLKNPQAKSTCGCGTSFAV
jgi:iron-sulfur cluster insertion protein